MTHANPFQPHPQASPRPAPQAAKTPANTLRQILRDLEKRISRMAELSAPQALEILSLLDQAAASIQSLEAGGMNLSSEISQFETIQSQFSSQGRRFLARIGGAPALRAARQQHATPNENWWWRIDRLLVEQSQAQLKRSLTITVIVLLLLAGAYLLYQRFLAPDPQVAARYGHLQVAENNLTSGDYENSYTELQAALAYAPDDPELLILQGVLLEYLDDPQGALESFDAAEKLAASQVSYHEIRSGYFLMAGQFERVIDEAGQAIALDADSVMGYLHTAQAYESLGRYPEAIEYYELANQVAEQIGNVQLQVIIRVNLSNVLQRNMQSIPTPYATP